MKNKNIIPPNIEMFQEFLNGIISPIAYLDTECNFILVNQAYANADNKTPEFFPGLNHFDLYPDQDNQKIFQSVIDKGEPYKCTARPFEYADHPERETSYWDWELNPIKDTNDNINGVVLSLIDVTERINIEKEQAHNLLIQEIVASIIELSLQPLPFKEFLRQALVFALQANKLDLALQGVIFLLNPESGELEMCVRHGLPDSIVSSCSTVTRGECICGKALEQEKLIFTSCVDHQHSVTYEGMSSHGHYCIPIKSQGEILGVLNLYVEHGHKSNRVEEQFVNTIADTLAVAILRERTSKALKESEKRFRAITETANDAIISINTDGKIISWNRGAKSIFGYEYEDIINHPLSAIIPEKYQKLFKRKMRLWNKTGKIQHTNIPMEASGLRMDGTEMALEILFSNWTLEGKEYTTGIVRDITKRKQTERLSQENEKKFKAILEASPIPLALNNDQGNITYINKAFVQATGYTTQDIPHLTDWWPLAYPDPEYRQLVIEIWTTHLEHAKETNSKFTPIEINVSCKNGSTRTFIASAASLDNNFFDNHLVVLYDITERKQTENALSDSYNLLQTIIDTAPVRIFWKDKQLRYLGCNPALSKDAGELSPQDIIGKSDFQLNWKNQAELYQSDDYNVMKTNTAKLSYVEPQTTPEGNTLWRRTSKVPLINAENETIGILGIYQDITEQKKIETELQIAATAFEANVGIMVTDTNGTIVKINKAFTEQSGYSSEETLGQTPSLFKSGRHDKGFYAAMWDSIKNKGVWSGEIWDRRKNGEIYPKWLNITAIKAADGSVTHFVSTQNDITELKISENEIKTLAFYDSLTSLPNRRLLQDRLQQALASSERTGQVGALLLLDLDHFKTINDTLGHLMGDNLLQEVAQRLIDSVREKDTVARLGGDEYIVMLEDLNQDAIEAANQAESIAEKVLMSLCQPYMLGEHEWHNTSSIGITLFNGHKFEINELFQQADIAMYEAKKAGRNKLHFFDPQTQEAINARVALGGELRNALERQQLYLYYQVQVDDLNHPYGVEALIRWIHPERGLIAPNQFIPLSEESELIFSIGQWVMETACAQLESWQKDPLTDKLSIAVNVSAKEFRQTDYVSQVQTILQHHNINPNLLKLELTESILVDDIEKTIETMSELQKIGVRLSLDDFGTGYSSLQYLKRLPINQLKIDQSFVRDITAHENDKAIVTTIIALAHGLNIDVIAEGVETKEQREHLFYAGCKHYQGYYFSKPMPVEQLERQLKQDSKN